MNDKKRAGIAMLLIAFGQIMRINAKPVLIIVGTCMLMVALYFLFPVLKKRCDTKRELWWLWILSVAGVGVVLADTTFRVIDLLNH